MEGYIKEKNQSLKVIMVPYKTYKQDKIDIIIIIRQDQKPNAQSGFTISQEKRLKNGLYIRRVTFFTSFNIRTTLPNICRYRWKQQCLELATPRQV